MFYEAYELFDKGRYQECLPMFNQILETTQDNHLLYWSYILSGRSKRSMGEDGINLFFNAHNIFPERAEALCDIGMHYYEHRDLKQAERFFKIASTCNKSHRCIRYEEEKYFEFPMQMLIDICIQQNRYNDSEELISDLLRRGNPGLYDTKKLEYNHLYSRHYNNAGLEFIKAKTIQASGTLIIQLPTGYDGLGDNLVFSHIPRIAKESGRFDTVLISNQNKYKGKDYSRIVWETNPYVDGFTDMPGTYSSIQINRIMDKWNNLQPSINLMDGIMLLHNLDDGKRGHVPECYYEPNEIIELKDKVVLDLGSKTINLSGLNVDAFIKILEDNGIIPDYVLSSKTVDIPGINVLETNSIEHWADVMFSAKHYVCFNSGGYWLSGALGVKSKHIWIDKKNLPAWSYLDHDNIFVPLSTICQEGT